MTPRLRCVVPFVTMALIACGGHPRPHQAVNQAAAGAYRIGDGSTAPPSDGACPDVAGSWLLGQNECAGDSLVIAQDGCNVAVSWYGSFSGALRGNALTFSGAGDPSLVCTAAVTGDSLSGSCTGATVDGSDCAFEATFEGK